MKWTVHPLIRLAYNAFHKVLSRKQSRYGEVIAWLGAETWKLGLLNDFDSVRP